MTTGNDPDADARTEALESHAAHQARAIEELEDMVRAQWEEIESLKRRLNAVVRRLGEMTRAGDAPEEAPENGKPPHY